MVHIRHCAWAPAMYLIQPYYAGKDGQIGNGTNEMTNSKPVEVEALRGKNIVDIACGAGHTGALGADGTLYLWGRGRHGQLGRGDSKESVAFYKTSPLAVEGVRVDGMALGADHTLVILK